MASSDQPSDSTAATQQVRINTAYESFKHNASLAMLVLAPVLIAIPPRKLDLYTFSLTGAFVASANQLNIERTGRGLLSQFGYDFNRDARTRTEEDSMRKWKPISMENSTTYSPLLSEGQTQKKGSTNVTESIGEKAKEVWMGAETEGWKERRLKEEQEKLDRGEGYGSMIMDQIWEVWNWGEKKGDELKKHNQKVIDESKST